MFHGEHSDNISNTSPYTCNYIIVSHHDDTYYNFHESPFIPNKVMAQKLTNSLKLRQSKSNNSCISKDILMKLHFIFSYVS